MVFVSKYSEFQVLAIIDEYVAGAIREDLCAHYQITPRTFFRWIARYGHSRPALRQMVDNLQRDNEALKARLAAQAGEPADANQDAPKSDRPSGKKLRY